MQLKRGILLFYFINLFRITHVKEPTIGQSKLNLYQLYLLVEEYGGYKRVSADRAWKRIADRFDLPSTCTNAAFALKQTYIKYILDLFPDQVDAQSSKATTKATAGSPVPRKLEASEGHLVGVASGWTVEGRMKIRLLRALECGLAEELDWALNELLKMSSDSRDTIFYFYTIPGISPALLELFISHMHRAQECKIDACPELFANLKKILIILWNCCYENSRNAQFVVLDSKDLLNDALALAIKLFDLFQPLGLSSTLLGLLECFCREQIFVLDGRVGTELQNFLCKSLQSPDRHIRLCALSVMKETLGNIPNTHWSWMAFESSLGEFIFFNALIQDDFIQNAIVDYFFNLSDALEAFGSVSSLESLNISKPSFGLIIDTLFHIVFDNFSFSKHLKNISYKTLLKDSRLSIVQVLSKWLLLCYVPSKVATDLVAVTDIYNQFEMFCAREGIPNGPIEYSQLLSKVCELYPKCIVPNSILNRSDDPPGTTTYALLKARDWNERSVKTTEKVINAILTLRNFAVLSLPSDYIEDAFLVHWDSICQLAIQPDSNGNFIAKHFGLILSELFCREIFFDANLFNKF